MMSSIFLMILRYECLQIVLIMMLLICFLFFKLAIMSVPDLLESCETQGILWVVRHESISSDLNTNLKIRHKSTVDQA